MTSAHMILGDARAVPLADDTVDCIVTSPPYNVGLDYTEGDNLTLDEYTDLARASCTEMHRILKPGGRLWLNIVQSTSQLGDFGRATGTRLNLLDLWTRALEATPLLYRDTAIWNKDAGNQPTAWGSYLSPNAPNLRGRYEPILIYFKEHWDRGRPDGPNDIPAAEWPVLTRNVWTITPNGTSRWHPAPFPLELPRRAILLSTWPNDLVVDPYAGAGTTLTAAYQLGRRALGLDISPAYVARFKDTGLQPQLDI